jgi:hypothetical protein
VDADCASQPAPPSPAPLPPPASPPQESAPEEKADVACGSTDEAAPTPSPVADDFPPLPKPGKSREAPKASELRALPKLALVEDWRATRCLNCGRAGHSRSECRSMAVQARNIVRCFNCDETGHRSQDCTKPKQYYKQCSKCGGAGHLASGCTWVPPPPPPAASQPRPRPAPYRGGVVAVPVPQSASGVSGPYGGPTAPGPGYKWSAHWGWTTCGKACTVCWPQG